MRGVAAARGGAAVAESYPPVVPPKRGDGRERRGDGWEHRRDCHALVRPLVLTRPVGASLVVEAVCPRAQHAGVRPGLTLGQACALAPGLVALSHEPQRDRLMLGRLARYATRFSPLVEPAAPDMLLLDITGCQRLFGGELNLARQVVQGLERFGFYARAGVADTVGAACALATAASERITIAPPGQTVAALAPLPPGALRIEAGVAERLDSLGVRSIGDLLAIPRHLLPARFGPQLVLRLQQALGEVVECVSPFQADELPAVRRPFDPPLGEPAIVAETAVRLLDELFKELHRCELALQRLDCLLCFEDGRPQTVSVGLTRATRAAAHVATLLRQRLERFDWLSGGLLSRTRASRPRDPACKAHAYAAYGEGVPRTRVEPLDDGLRISGLVLMARRAVRCVGGQGELFDLRDPRDDEAIGVLVDRLAAQLGYNAVVRPQLVDDHQPEMTFRWLAAPEVGCGPEAARPVAAAPARDGAGVGGYGLTWPARPARLLSRPMPVRAIALAPDGPPTWFSCGRRAFGVAEAYGPERIETAWWRGQDVCRDYFRVTADSGEQFWLFRELKAGRWFLHGVFV